MGGSSTNRGSFEGISLDAETVSSWICKDSVRCVCVFEHQ